MKFVVNIIKMNKGGVNKSPLQKWLLAWVHGYDHEKYWKRRSIVINSKDKTPKLIKLYYLLWIKRIDARHHCSFGTNLNAGSEFATPPFLPHGPNGIICGHDIKVGAGCIIYHQVTIAGGNVKIGEYTELGAGVKVLPNVKIGSHCHIGANAVVVEDVPDYATCVLTKPRIIVKRNKDKE
ncbi:transferase [Bacteroides reticulotermitis]|uniref:transferase n=1 Tax=Bacteroides reticulotermitis TaxID=1133319 RepID=UPI003A8A7498